MLEIIDSRFNWKAKVIDYKNGYNAIHFDLNDKPLRIEIVISDSQITMELRDDKHFILNRKTIDFEQSNE
jgi:hypothetical protein